MFFKKKKPSDKEFARVIDWQPKWSSGAPIPQVFTNGHSVYLIYLIHMPNPNWDGTYVTGISNTSETKYPLALVEFSGDTFRFGIANDEVFNGLALWDKGLEFCEAHIIENSKWIEELDNIQKAHPYYDRARLGRSICNHYMLLFHDQILEVIATDYKVEIFNTSFKDLAIEVAKRMNG